MSNELIYGKSNLSRIVSIEPGEDTAEVFRELEDGSVVSEFVPNTYYILYANQYSPKMKRLEGDQYYRWIWETQSKEKFYDVLKSSSRAGYEYHAIRDNKEALMVREGYTYYKDMKVEDVSVLSFDLEHGYGIGEQLNKNGQLYLISNTFERKGQVIRRLFALDEFESERAMIEAWVKWVCEMNPSIVTGHNTLGHDFQILKHASAKTGAKLKLGRNGSVVRYNKMTSQFRKDQSQTLDYVNAHIYGREIVCTYFLALKTDIAKVYETYSLKQIIKQEGLERPNRAHYDASKIIQDWQDVTKRPHIKTYANDDSDDAWKLCRLFMPSFFYYAQSVPRSFQAIINGSTGSQINSMMVRAYLQDGHSIAKASPKVKYSGAISFGNPGIHRNVLRFDVASLYPSIIRQYRVFHPQKDPKELFLKIVEYFTLERLNNKRLAKETGERYYKDLQESQKIAINSMYGFLGAGRQNYNYFEGADMVTAHGRRILKMAIKWATGQDYDDSRYTVEETEPDIEETEEVA